MGKLSRAGALLAAWLAFAASTRAEPLPCAQDERLAETAADLLRDGAKLASAELMRAARARGFDGVALHARESADDAALDAFVRDLAVLGEGPVSCGEARSSGRRLVLAVARGGRLWRRDARLFGQLEPGFEAPSLVLETRAGELVAQPTTSGELARGIALPDVEALRRVQLTAVSASGPRPVAELRFEPVPSAALQVEPSGTPQLRTRAALRADVDAFRREAGAGRLRENQLLDQSAQHHGEALCARGRLAHRLDGEDPEQRLRRARIAARGVGEVLARADSSRAAFAALLDSPVHRLALGRREFTDVGVGQAVDENGRVCLVVLLAAWPRRLP